MKISIITPTYNRAYILTQCYESLVKQTKKEFEWIIVDDGSTDETEDKVQDFLSEGKIEIKYFKQANGGKHRAHNVGVKNATGELCLCLDSDDALAPNAIECAERIWLEHSSEKVIGILALRGDFKEHRPICSLIPEGIKSATMSELRDKYNFQGDTILFFRTDLLKRHLFREFKDEKFLTENNLYVELDSCGEMILLNEVLYYCEYLPDGLTAKYRRLLLNNPKGTADTYYRMSVYANNWRCALKYAVIAQAYLSLAKDKSELVFSRRKFLMCIARLGVPYYKKRYMINIS